MAAFETNNEYDLASLAKLNFSWQRKYMAEEDEEKDDGIEVESEISGLPDEIKKPFDPSKIKVNRKIVTINLIVDRIGHKEIDLSPDFQRRARVWDASRKSRLIESIMLRIPLPVFYVAADSEENWRVVDGLQRLTTINDYLDSNSEHRFPLKGLEYLTDYQGAYFDDLPRSIKRRIRETELNINVIESGTPEEVMFNIFRRINTGGMSLNSQEIRNALHPGQVRNFLIDMSESEEFLLSTDYSVKDTRMGARELVLRFCAFYLDDFLRYPVGDLDGFLNNAMDNLNSFPPEKLRKIGKIFKKAMDRCWKIFDDQSFRKVFKNQERRSPVNRALFEALSVSFANLQPDEFEIIYRRRKAFKKRFLTMMEDELFIRSISLSTSSKKMVEYRFNAVGTIILDTLND